ncbi:MAG: hypothetical protein WC340_07500 [Kiritimatiellia bacterium]
MNAPAVENVVLRESERLTIGHKITTPAVTARGYSAAQGVGPISNRTCPVGNRTYRRSSPQSPTGGLSSLDKDCD